MDKANCSDAAEMQRVLDLIVTKAGRLKSSIEDLQCRAIEARLDLMAPDTRERLALLNVRQDLVQVLDTLIDEIEAMLAALAPPTAESTILQ